MVDAGLLLLLRSCHLRVASVVLRARGHVAARTPPSGWLRFLPHFSYSNITGPTPSSARRHTATWSNKGERESARRHTADPTVRDDHSAIAGCLPSHLETSHAAVAHATLLCNILARRHVLKQVWDEERNVYLRSDGEPSPFPNIPNTFWWAVVTMTTVCAREESARAATAHFSRARASVVHLSIHAATHPPTARRTAQRTPLTR